MGKDNILRSRSMRPLLFACLALFGCVEIALAPAVHAETLPPVGRRIAEVAARDAVSGKHWSLTTDARKAQVVVVVFLGTECPVSNAYVSTLARMHKEWAAKGVMIVGVNANTQDDVAAVAKHAIEYEIPFPVLKDESGEIAGRFHAERLPTAFILDGTRTVRYRGRIDNQFERSVKRPRPTQYELRDAVDAVLARAEVTKPATEVVGCPINRPHRKRSLETTDHANTGVTYSRQISRIIQTHCQECHRPGQVGPFKLMKYSDAAAWSDAIREVVAQRIMPPWHADSKPGMFANDPQLSDADRNALLAWVDAGCPEGDRADLPEPKKYIEEWGIGTPNEILKANEEKKVPAQAPAGGIPYQYVLVGKPFAQERWVRAAEVRAGNPGVVHHIVVHILKPGQKLSTLTNSGSIVGLLLTRPQDQPDQLISFVPGDRPIYLPKGQARRLVKGSQLVFEVHYTPNGKAGVDRSAIGLVYAEGPPSLEVKNAQAVNWMFRIPARAADYKVRAEYVFPQDALLLTLNPHMHLRGKSFEYRLRTPDGKEEVLLRVPKYDFNWQHTYIFATPKPVAKGSKLLCLGHFDNSEGNPNNPDPSKAVEWGDQTWDEMMVGFFDYGDNSP
jgi:peroxiredoxin